VDAASLTETAWIFPGLGARFVGMGGDLLGQHPAADRLVRQAEDWLGYAVAPVCLEGSGRKVVPARQEAQVIYVIDCAYADALRARQCHPAVTCGHSLGAWSAAYAAGAYDFRTGLELVTRVEDVLAETLAGQDQAMGVVIGLPEETVTAFCHSASDPAQGARGGVHLANQNSKGQYVVAGSRPGVEAVLARAQAAGAVKARTLAVARAMHTPLLAGAAGRVAAVLDRASWSRPAVPFVCTSTGRWLTSAADVRQFFGSFLQLPVRWEATMRGLLDRGVTTFVDVGPGGILASMMPFIDRAARVATASERLAGATLRPAPDSARANALTTVEDRR
jgi:[acyl-carrier-protein] S-malonyltransferase